MSGRNFENNCLRCEVNVIVISILILYLCLVFIRHGLVIVNGKLEVRVLSRYTLYGLLNFRNNINTTRVGNGHFLCLVSACFCRYTEDPNVGCKFVNLSTRTGFKELAAKSKPFRFLSFDNDVFLEPVQVRLVCQAILIGLNYANLVRICDVILIIVGRYITFFKRTIDRELCSLKHHIMVIVGYFLDRQITERYESDILGHIGIVARRTREEIEALVEERCVD